MLRSLNRYQSRWIQPKGYDTGIKIYSCVAKKRVPLILNKKGIITWYTCGPTVYDSAHAGHGSCYVKMDIIQRILSKYFKYNVLTVMNITDVDDKIIARSKELNKTTEELAAKYESEFWNDLLKLKIPRPNLVLRVSENIDSIVDFIDELLHKGVAYVDTDGSVYFKVKTFKDYGKMVNLTKTTETHNENEMDFALWKARKGGEPSWDSPWGPGRPGWHIECSTLATKVFGSSIDIHAGGMDLKFPHHENEEAQSCAYHSCDQWVNYWLHVGQLHAKASLKMSKSLRNTVSLTELLATASSDVFRLACAMSHYRSRMDYSKELLKTAERTLNRYRNFVDNCDNYVLRSPIFSTDNNELEKMLLDSIEQTDEALRNDFDTAEVIGILNNIVKKMGKYFKAEPSDFAQTTSVIGLRNFFSEILQSIFNITITEEVTGTRDSLNTDLLDILNEFRRKVRLVGVETMDKEVLRLCDETRIKLEALGIRVKDLKSISSSR